MITTQSILGLSATALYLLIGSTCGHAAVTAFKVQRPKPEVVWWALFAIWFFALVALRLSGLEEYFREGTRSVLRKDGVYEMRREVQAPLSVMAILCTAGLVALTARWHSRRRPGSPSRLIAYARLAVAGLCGLIILRVISFHAVDVLLYGPAKLNWVIDIGASLFTGWCAYRFGQIARMRGARR